MAAATQLRHLAAAEEGALPQMRTRHIERHCEREDHGGAAGGDAADDPPVAAARVAAVNRRSPAKLPLGTTACTVTVEDEILRNKILVG